MFHSERQARLFTEADQLILAEYMLNKNGDKKCSKGCGRMFAKKLAQLTITSNPSAEKCKLTMDTFTSQDFG